MGPCHHCGESVSDDARICKHCSREVLYEISLHPGDYSDRDAFGFLKAWHKVKINRSQRKALANISDAKQALKNSETAVIWDLTKKQAKEICEILKAFKPEFSIQTIISHEQSEKSGDSLRIKKMGASVFIALTAILIGVVIADKMDNEQHIAIDKVESNFSESPIEISINSSEVNNSTTPFKESVPKPSFEVSSGSSWGPQQMDRLLNATVFIRDQKSLGSGFLISSDGYLLSNSHVTSNMTSPTVVMRDGRQFDAVKVSEDKDYDISLLKISISKADFLELGDANHLFPGQNVITIGNPGGLSFTVTKGIVSFVGRLINDVPYIQTDAAINRGNSGGPMINEELKVVGINTLTSLNEQGISFAVPINLACGSDGIAWRFIKQPCPLFDKRDRISQVRYQRQNTPKQDSSMAKIYEDQLNALKSELKKSDQQLDQEQIEIKSKIASLQSISSGSSSNNLDINQRELLRLQEQLIENSKRKVEARIRYLKQCIALLERQRADPLYEQYRADLDKQIEGLRTQQSEFESQLN